MQPKTSERSFRLDVFGDAEATRCRDRTTAGVTELLASCAVASPMSRRTELRIYYWSK
jgi:hypothetical protein